MRRSIKGILIGLSITILVAGLIFTVIWAINAGKSGVLAGNSGGSVAMAILIGLVATMVLSCIPFAFYAIIDGQDVRSAQMDRSLQAENVQIQNLQHQNQQQQQIIQQLHQQSLQIQKQAEEWLKMQQSIQRPMLPPQAGSEANVQDMPLKVPVLEPPLDSSSEQLKGNIPAQEQFGTPVQGQVVPSTQGQAATPEQGQVEPPIQGQAATSMEQMPRTPIQPRKAEYSTPAETVLLHPNMVAPEVQDRDNLQREMDRPETTVLTSELCASMNSKSDAWELTSDGVSSMSKVEKEWQCPVCFSTVPAGSIRCDVCGYDICIAEQEKMKEEAIEGGKECSFCHKMIKPDATYCRYCGAYV